MYKKISISTVRMSSTDLFLPPAFLLLLKMSLHRLVAIGLLPKELVGNEFWTLLKNKFANAVAYKKRLEKAKQVRDLLLTSNHNLTRA